MVSNKAQGFHLPMSKFEQYLLESEERHFTIKDVNKKLAPLNMTLVKGKGYFYFVHPEYAFKDSSVMVYKITDQSIDAWLQDAKDKLDDIEKD
jgi:hypothetical protein